MEVKLERCDKQEWLNNWVLSEAEEEEEEEKEEEKEEEWDTSSYVRT